MSIIETIRDVNNTFLSRRELICNFTGLGGKLKKMEAIDMITKEFKLDGKIIIPMKLQNHVGMPLITVCWKKSSSHSFSGVAYQDR